MPFPFPSRQIPIATVHADADGVLFEGKAPRPTVDPWRDSERNEAWWTAVQFDPRLKLPEESTIPEHSPDAAYRLDRYIGHYFEFACRCGGKSRGRRWTVQHLLANFGPAANTVYLARNLTDCKARNKVTNNCRAYPVR